MTMPRQLKPFETNGLKHSGPVLPKLATKNIPSKQRKSHTILAQVSTTSDTGDTFTFFHSAWHPSRQSLPLATEGYESLGSTGRGP
jgi:hypothetical protein